jgi:long-subunit fatty acid transport protein
LDARRPPRACGRWPLLLPRNNDVAYERGDLKFKVNVPDEVDFKVEIEVQDDEWELEVELTWGRKHRRGAKRS